MNHMNTQDFLNLDLIPTDGAKDSGHFSCLKQLSLINDLCRQECSSPGWLFRFHKLSQTIFTRVFKITLSSSSLQMCNSGQSLRFFYEARLVWHGWGDIIRNHNVIALTPTYSSNSPPYLLQISWCFLWAMLTHQIVQFSTTELIIGCLCLFSIC